MRWERWPQHPMDMGAEREPIYRGINPCLTALTGSRRSYDTVTIDPQCSDKRARMSFAYLKERLAAAGAVLLLGLSLGGCASSNSSLMDARAEAPTPAEKYLPVEDLPPKREKPAMTVDEQSKLKKQLLDARNRQGVAVKARDNSGGK
jgi:hypothetical protein